MAYVPELKSSENTYFSELNESDTKKSFPYIKVGLVILAGGLAYYYKDDIKKFFGKAKEKYQSVKESVKSKTSGGGLITIKPSSTGMFLSALAPYIVIGGLIYYYRKDIKKLLPFNISSEKMEQAKEYLSNEIKKEGIAKTGWNIIKGIAYTIYEPKYKDADYFKNQQWIIDLKKGWKTKQQVLDEIQKTGYKVLPELDKLLRS